jgi:hypothetical protein
VQDGQHLGEEGAVTAGPNPQAVPAGESDVDRHSRVRRLSVDNGDGEEGGSARRRCRVTRGASRLVVAFADDPPPGVKRGLVQGVLAAVRPDRQTARGLTLEVAPPELVELGIARGSRHIEDSVRKSSRLPSRSRTPFTARILKV